MSVKPSRAYLRQILPNVADDEPSRTQQDGRIEIRYETYSPIEEYAVREGETEPLDEEFHAVLSMDYRGVATVDANGVTIKARELVGPARSRVGVTYWHPDSNLCNRVADGPIQVRYTYNPARPGIIHLWDLEWKYLESLPERERIHPLDNATLAEAGKAAKRQIKRFADTLQDLQQDQSHKAVADAIHNAAEMDRVAIALNLPRDSAARPQSDRSSTATPGFVRAREDAEALLETNRLREDLLETAAELQTIARRRNTPVASEAEAWDPFDI